MLIHLPGLIPLAASLGRIAPSDSWRDTMDAMLPLDPMEFAAADSVARCRRQRYTVIGRDTGEHGRYELLTEAYRRLDLARVEFPDDYNFIAKLY